MMDTQLTQKGWFLSELGLRKCKDGCARTNPTVTDIINIALAYDLRQISRECLPDNINSGQITSLNGPVVLQVQKVRNLSAPMINQESIAAPRMFKLNVTDGNIHCIAIEFKYVSSLSFHIIPGTKICLLGSNITVSKGVILLEDNNVKVIGGHVDKLRSKWETDRDAGGIKRYVSSLNFRQMLRGTEGKKNV